MTHGEPGGPGTLLAEAGRIAGQYIGAGHVPGVILSVAQADGPAEYLALGVDGAGRALAVDTLMPVASVTKLATALAVLRLVDAGALDLDAPLARYLPDATGAPPGATLRQTLCHTAGLAPDPESAAPPYGFGLDWPALARACLSIPAIAAPGTQVQYSNTGYGLLAVIVERQARQIFREALQALVFDPLGVEGYLGVEPPRPAAKVLALRGPHTDTPLESYNSPFWRSLALPWGGLLTTVDGALRLVRAFRARPSGFLSPELQAEATRDQTGGVPGAMIGPPGRDPYPWGLGPELRDEKNPHWAPAQASPGSFGHPGASGSLAWYDPAVDVAWAIAGPRQLADTLEAITWHYKGMPAIGAAILAAARM